MSQKIVPNEPIKAYKAFDKNFKCRGFQYEVGETYHIDEEVEICRKGFHACKNCMNVLRYYPLNDSRFAEVEVWGNVVFPKMMVNYVHLTLRLLENWLLKNCLPSPINTFRKTIKLMITR